MSELGRTHSLRDLELRVTPSEIRMLVRRSGYELPKAADGRNVVVHLANGSALLLREGEKRLIDMDTHFEIITDAELGMRLRR